MSKPTYAELVAGYEKLLAEYIKLYDSRPYTTRARDFYVVRMARDFLREAKDTP